MKKYFANQTGQVIVVLLLVMLVALSVGLALTQKSITDLTTSTQSEQSSRSFSAAEAGIEKALVTAPNPNLAVPLENNSSATVNSSALLPQEDAAAGVGIEYPPIGKETTAQFWLVDPSSTSPTPVAFYDRPGFIVLFGNERTTDKPAVEIKVITLENGVYKNHYFFYDSDQSRTVGANKNGFNFLGGCDSQNLAKSILGTNRKFYCAFGLSPIKKADGSGQDCTPTYSCILVLVRIRFLYIEDNQKLALAPLDDNAKFPPQVQLYNSVGVSGQSKKQLQAFRVKDAVPPWFDFAIFSVNEILK